MAGGMMLMCFVKSCRHVFPVGAADPYQGSRSLGQDYTVICPECGAQNVVAVAAARYKRSLG